MVQVSIIGNGNVATQLAKNLHHKGVKIVEICSKNNPIELIHQTYSKWKKGYDFTKSKIDFLIICVNDDSIKLVSEQVKVSKSTIVLHTSGTKSIEILNLYFKRCGVFYPLQSISKHHNISFEQIPILIEANTIENENETLTFAKIISNQTLIVNSELRKRIHLSAVFVNNFVNYLFIEAEELLKENNLNLSILEPLMLETVRKAIIQGAYASQTGPAKRADKDTIKNHTSILENDVSKLEIYTLFSKLIDEKFNKN